MPYGRSFGRSIISNERQTDAAIERPTEVGRIVSRREIFNNKRQI